MLSDAPSWKPAARLWGSPSPTEEPQVCSLVNTPNRAQPARNPDSGTRRRVKKFQMIPVPSHFPAVPWLTSSPSEPVSKVIFLYHILGQRHWSQKRDCDIFEVIPLVNDGTRLKSSLHNFQSRTPSAIYSLTNVYCLCEPHTSWGTRERKQWHLHRAPECRTRTSRWTPQKGWLQFSASETSNQSFLQMEWSCGLTEKHWVPWADDRTSYVLRSVPTLPFSSEIPSLPCLFPRGI